MKTLKSNSDVLLLNSRHLQIPACHVVSLRTIGYVNIK